MGAYFTCKNCRQEHLSPLFFADENAFREGQFGTNIFVCPITLKKSNYCKLDMFWIRGETKARDRLRVRW